MKWLRSLLTVSGLTVVSRIFGLIREILVSHILGAQMITDAFLVAFKLPNLFRRFFGEGAFNASFVPRFTGILSTKGEKDAYQMAQDVFSLLTLVLLLLVLFVEIFTPYVVSFFAPGFIHTKQRFDLAVSLTRITFPYIFFISLTALLSGILNSFHRFFESSAAPIVLNIFMIMALLYYSLLSINPETALALSVFLAGIVQFLWLYFKCYKLNFRLRLGFPELTFEVRKVLCTMGPGIIGASIVQINLLVDMFLASFLKAGSISYLYYADRLVQLPLSISGIALGTVLLPSLSRYWRTDNKNGALKTQEDASKLAIYISIPAAVGLISLSLPFVRLIFGHGRFLEADVLNTAPALAALASGLPAYVLSKVLTTVYFAKGNTKTPVYVGFVSVLFNILLNIVFMQYWFHVGLALATSLASWLNFSILVILLYRQNSFSISFSMVMFFSKVLFSALVMYFCLYFSLNFLDYYFSNFALLDEIIYTSILISIGVAVYFIMTFLLGVRSFKKYKNI
ncbi:MAG: murein biosynthesis integral membrane protein MurJ [Alphaproteobacteria bacterium]